MGMEDPSGHTSSDVRARRKEEVLVQQCRFLTTRLKEVAGHNKKVEEEGVGLREDVKRF